MEEKRRVILYKELREKISQMDRYSFEDEEKENGDDTTELSSSIDEMLAEKQRYQAKQEEKSRRANYVSRHQKTNRLERWQIILLLCLTMALIASLFIILFANGVL